MMRRLYTLAAIGAQPFLRRKLKRRGEAEPAYLDHVEERFGRYAEAAAPGALWIHAVSLGETRAAEILLRALRERDPSLRVLLTHGTATGREAGRKLLRPGDLQAWLPWDTPQAVNAFLDHFRPWAGVLMETEVWPNLVAESRRHRVPLVLANARLSPKTLAQTRRFGRLARPAYGALAQVWAQTDDDAHRLRQLGANVSGVFGNLKFDAAPDPALLARGTAWRIGSSRPVVLFASSREGEEAAFFDAIVARREGGRTARRDAGLLRAGERGPARRQLRAARGTEPDRGGRLRLPRGDGAAHVQFRRASGDGTGSGRGCARADDGGGNRRGGVARGECINA
jgi:3-deoxy-D-manno-octulosonic-acid transferase